MHAHRVGRRHPYDRADERRGPRDVDPAAPFVDLQRTAGNRAVAGLLASSDSNPTVQRAGAGRGIITLGDVEITRFGAQIHGLPTGGERPVAPNVLPALLADDVEAAYKTTGEARLASIGGGPTPVAGPQSGHTPTGPIASFPGWFSTLQNALIASTEWRQDKEELAQNLLEEYAIKRFAVAYGGDERKIPPTIRVYAQYIGRSTSNTKAAERAGLPSSRDMGGKEGAKLWCAAAGSNAVIKAVTSLGLTFATNQTEWLLRPPVPEVNLPDAPVKHLIEPGDQVSYIGGGAPAVGGHTTTAITASQGEGSVFVHASGNAGGGASGSVRLSSSKPRMVPPKAIGQADYATKSPASLGALADAIWVYTIVRYSQLWDDLGKIDLKAPGVWSTTAGAAFLRKYKLRPKTLTP
jgi:hypothetical protein